MFDPELLKPIIAEAGAAVGWRSTAEGLEAVADAGGRHIAHGTVLINTAAHDGGVTAQAANRQRAGEVVSAHAF